MTKLSIKLITIVLALAVAVLAGWLVIQNLPYYGTTITKLDFDKDQPVLSSLGPSVRTVKVDNDLAILESPVYFDLRSLPWFNKAQIYLTYQADGAVLENMAGQVGPGWQYHPVEPVAIRDLDDGPAGWQKAIFEFDLKTLYSQKNVRRFLISTNHDDGGRLLIQDLTIILEK